MNKQTEILLLLQESTAATAASCGQQMRTGQSDLVRHLETVLACIASLEHLKMLDLTPSKQTIYTQAQQMIQKA
jgi:hypothetical protein